MARTHLSKEEHDMASLVLENKLLTADELLQLCVTRLGITFDQAWSIYTTLLLRQILTTVDGCIVVREDSEEIQELVLEQAMERAERTAVQRRQENEDTPRGRMFHPHPDAEPEAPPPPVTPPPPKDQTENRPPMSNGTAQPSTPPPAAAEQEEAEQEHPSRRRLYILVGCAAVLVVLLTAVLVNVLRPPTYPRTVRSGGRELILMTAPEDEAQKAAETWLIRFVKGRTDAAPFFKTLTVSGMRVYDMDQRWDEESATLKSGSGFDPAYNFRGKVVFVDALAAGGPEPEEGTQYQYRIYLQGDEEDGYSVYACRSCPAAWVECYDQQVIQLDGEDAAISLFGEKTEQGHHLRVVSLERGEKREILYLNEDEGSDYDQQVRLSDLNADGELDMVIEAQEGQQMCYLYDKTAGTYRFFPALSGGYVVSSPALTGAVLFTRLEGEDVTAFFCRWGDDGQFAELARMESKGTGTGGRVCSYYVDGQQVQEYTQDGSVTPGDLELNQQTLFNQYMAYVFWDELVLETARDEGILVLPETVSPAEDWQPLTLLADYPEEDLSLYVSPSELLLVRRGENLQVIPCSFTGQHPMPTVTDLDGNGLLDILLPFNDITPALLLARWGGEEWALTGFDLGSLQTDFKENVTLTWTRQGAQLSYEGAYGSSTALWKGDEIAGDESGELTLNMKDYVLTVEGGSTLSVAFPVRIEREDGGVLESELYYTVQLHIPAEGVPEVTSSRFARK